MATKQLKKHFEQVTYTHKGIDVCVEVDYDKGTISLIADSESAEPKRWVFAGRQIEYMQGWQDIFDAMKFAVDEATKELQKHKDAKEREKARLMKLVTLKD